MTPPIRIRRRWEPECDRLNRPMILRPGSPWWWTCALATCPGSSRFGLAPTQPEARDAGLAHLATHKEPK